jgi:hypothetical protein
MTNTAEQRQAIDFQRRSFALQEAIHVVSTATGTRGAAKPEEIVKYAVAFEKYLKEGAAA